MKIKSLLYSCFTIVCFAHNLPAQSPQKIRIDPSQAEGGAVSTLFDEVTYIPLETTPKSLFGQVSQLYVTDGYFIILDYDTNSILLFTKAGKFHCKIEMGNIGKENPPYIGVRFFVVNPGSKEVSFKINDSKRWVYDFDGHKLREETVAMPGYYYFLPEGKTLYSWYDVRNNASDSSYELIWEDRGNIYRRGLPYATKNTFFKNQDIIRKTTSHFTESSNGDVVYYTKPFDYNVYRISADSITQPYSFIFPLAVSLPSDFSTSMAYYGKRFELLRQNPQFIFSITNFFELNHWLFFGIEQMGWNKDNSFIYDLRTGTLISVSHIDADSGNYFLPVRASRGFRTTDGVCMYTVISSLEMFQARDAAVNKKVKYSPDLADYFARGKESNNPVIVQLKPKMKHP